MSSAPSVDASSTRKRAGNMVPSTDDFKSSAKRQLGTAGSMAQQAALSAAWSYPIFGIYHLVSNPSLIQPVLPTLIKGTLVSLGIVIGMFVFTYLPQVAVLAFVSGPLAFIAAVPLVLGEAYVVVNFVTKAFFFDRIGTDLFDAVMVQKGSNKLVEKGRTVSKSGGGSKLGKVLQKPLGKFSVDNAVRYILTLSFNFVPVLGTAFFIGYNGYKSGPSYHQRYYELKGYDKAKKQAEVQKLQGSYSAFGTVALLLNLIPIANVFFQCSTAVGAALWASDIEKSTGEVSAGTKDVEVTF